MHDDTTVTVAGSFGPYRLDDLLGRGGMGEVWRAFDTRRERAVALKRMTSEWADDAHFRQRFRREAQVTARLASGHVIPIHDFGEIGGVLYVDMRLVHGQDLKATLDARPSGLGVARAVDIVEQLAAALDSAHAEGLVHRDIKPSNVLLEPSGSRDFVYLVDFGIASASDATRLTATGTVLGTPAYMAPELFRGSDPATPAVDIYALGCVLHEMLTGRRPFTGDSGDVIRHHVQSPPPLPSTLRRDLEPFDEVVATALAKDPTRRYGSAGALAVAAHRAGQPAGASAHDAPAPARVTSPATPTPPGQAPPAVGNGGGSRRPDVRVLLAVGAVALVAVLVLLGVVLLRGSSAPVSTAAPSPASTTEVPHALPLPTDAVSSGDVALSPDSRTVYGLRDAQAGALTVIDAATGSVRASVPVGAYPEALQASPDGSRVYVANTGQNGALGSTVSVVDTASDQVVATVTVAKYPDGLTVSPDGARVYVTCGQTTADPTGAVSIIDTARNTTVATVPVGRGPTNPAVSPDSRYAYIPNVGDVSRVDSTVSVIDSATNSVIRTLQTTLQPRYVAVSPDGGRLYVAALGTSHGATGMPNTQPQGALDVIDLATGTSTAVATDGVSVPNDVALSRDGTTLVVSEHGDPGGSGDAANSLLIMDAVSGIVRRSYILGGAPKEAAITADGTHAFVAVTNPTGVWQVPLT